MAMKLSDEIRMSFARAEGLLRLMVVNVVIFLAFSKAVLFLISSPCFADKAVDFATTNGTAKPKA